MENKILFLTFSLFFVQGFRRGNEKVVKDFHFIAFLWYSIYVCQFSVFSKTKGNIPAVCFVVSYVSTKKQILVCISVACQDSFEPELNQWPMDNSIFNSTVHRSTNWAIEGYVYWDWRKINLKKSMHQESIRRSTILWLFIWVVTCYEVYHVIVTILALIPKWYSK